MKTYRLLNDGETILDTDLCYGFDRKWITPQDTIGMPFNSEWIFPIKREVPPPQWQTGEIPEPTTFSVLVLETEGSGYASYQYFNALRNDQRQFYWCTAEECMNPNEMLTGIMTGCTGRWYIQQIELPL